MWCLWCLLGEFAINGHTMFRDGRGDILYMGFLAVVLLPFCAVA